MLKVLPPASLAELQSRATALAGRSLGSLAHEYNTEVPLQLTQAKGWVGQLLEKVLGATAANLSQPDFIHLGVELKTLPVSPTGIVRESTFVCSATLPFQETQWETSRVRRKLANVLWFPIEANPTRELLNQRLGTPLLWSPSDRIEQQLKQDWEELSERLILGKFDQLPAHLGVYLQLRPKAPNAKTFVQLTDHQGERVSVVPKGFYLRSKLTQHILQTHFVMA